MSEVPRGLLAELWYADPLDLADPVLLNAARSVAPAAEQQEGSLVVPHPGTDAASLLTVVTAASALGTEGKSLPDVSQTWDWPGAEQALQAARSSVLVTEMFAGNSTPQQRVSALTSVVAALVEAASPVAISWPLSQSVTDPEQLEVGALGGIVNVRLFSISNDPGVLLMDTLGLYVLGLPDVQCHFRDRPPAEIAATLFSTAAYLYAEGDVIADGHTISGPGDLDRVSCFKERALLEPSRLVLDIDLGDPYAAGTRDRAG